MNKKKVAYLSVFLTGVLLIVLFVFNPFATSRFSGTQGAAVYPAVLSPIAPTHLWEFEGTSLMTPSFGGTNFSNCLFTHELNGPVGKYIKYLSNNPCFSQVSVSPSSPVSSVAVEFLWKPDDIMTVDLVRSYPDDSFFISLNTPVNPDSTPELVFRTTGTSGTNTVFDDMRVKLDGIGPKSMAYYHDGNWHHVVFKYSNGVKEIWIDGVLPDGFSKTVANTTKVKTDGSSVYLFGNSGAERRYQGSLDQFAIYYNNIPGQDLPGNLIHQHYLNFQSGQAYATTTSITTVPNAPVVTAGLESSDYLPGAQVPSSGSWTEYSSVPPNVITQLKSVPLPRYKTNHTLLRNFNWSDLDYLSHFTPTDFNYNHPPAQITNAVDIAGEMAKKWNYYLDLSPGNGSSSNLQPSLVAYSNANPTLPVGVTLIRAGVPSPGCGNSCLTYQGFSPQYYLQNSSAQFIGTNNTPVTNKIWRPLASQFSNYAIDGVTQKNNLSNLVNQLTRPVPKIDFISENGEILAKYETPALTSDPDVNDAINASGLDPQTYMGKTVADMANQTYRDTILSLPGLAGTKYLEYAVDGWEAQTRFKWSEARKMQTPINGTYYATPDFYPRWPNNWMGKVSAWSGMYFLQSNLNTQHATNDKFFGAYVSAGWSVKAEENISPGQWLGLLKGVNNLGSEFMHTGFFNLDPYNVGWPAQKAWQNMMPSYSQAIFSKVDALYENSYIMTGDLPLEYWDDNGIPGYRFRSGRIDAFTTVRKENTANRYIISTNLNKYNNMAGSVPSSADIGITLDNQNLKFETRPQGSVYIYDKTGASPVFYQLDTWHESSHPWYWSKDFSFESEVYDSGTAGRTTTTPAGTVAGDYTNFTTYINPSTGATTYNFEPRDATGNSNKKYFVWVLVKSSTGSSVNGQFKIDSASPMTVSTNSTSFSWCFANSFSNITSNSQHTLTYTASSADFLVDKILLTEDDSLNLGTCGPETIPPTVSITAPINNANVVAGNVENIIADATDASGIASVEFFVDGVSIDVDNSYPYSTSWDTTGLSSGVHVLTALAIDTVGNQATSSGVNVNILSGTYVVISSLTDGQIVYSGQTYPMQAMTGGPITKVRYFRYDTNTLVTRKCASIVPPDFNCNWTPNGGILNLTVDFLIHAKGYNAQGVVVATSPTITVTRMAGSGNRNAGNINSGGGTNSPRATEPSVDNGTTTDSSLIDTSSTGDKTIQPAL